MKSSFTIHSKNCSCDKFSEEAGKMNTQRYSFYYKLKEVFVTLSPCMFSLDGTQHSEILDIAIRKLKTEEGIECKSKGYSEVLCTKEPLRHYFEKGTVLELIKYGSFGYRYYIVHDKNSEFVKNNIDELIVVGRPSFYL